MTCFDYEKVKANRSWSSSFAKLDGKLSLISEKIQPLISRSQNPNKSLYPPAPLPPPNISEEL